MIIADKFGKKKSNLEVLLLIGVMRARITRSCFGLDFRAVFLVILAVSLVGRVNVCVHFFRILDTFRHFSGLVKLLSYRITFLWNFLGVAGELPRFFLISKISIKTVINCKNLKNVQHFHFFPRF